MRKHSLKAGSRPKSRFGGDDRTINPGVSGEVAFQLYRIYYGQLKQDILGSPTKTYIFYFVWGFDCICVSELHSGLPIGFLLSMNHAGDPSHQQTATITAEVKETEGTAPVAKHEDTLRVHDDS